MHRGTKMFREVEKFRCSNEFLKRVLEDRLVNSDIIQECFCDSVHDLM